LSKSFRTDSYPRAKGRGHLSLFQNARPESKHLSCDATFQRAPFESLQCKVHGKPRARGKMRYLIARLSVQCR
jgi:hypothetical protein